MLNSTALGVSFFFRLSSFNLSAPTLFPHLICLFLYMVSFPLKQQATANALISIASGNGSRDGHGLGQGQGQEQGQGQGQDSPSISFQDFQHFLKIHRIEVIPTDKEWTRESLETLLKDLTQIKTSYSPIATSTPGKRSFLIYKGARTKGQRKSNEGQPGRRDLRHECR